MLDAVKPGADDGICHDKAALADKRKVMDVSWYNSMFFSISDTFKYLAGILTTVGMAMVVPKIIGAMSGTPDTPGVGFGEALSTLASTAPEGLGILGAAAAATAIGVGSGFISSRYYHTAAFDNMELNAQHTAKYLVQEIKKENSCIQEQPEIHEQNCRADGKSWQTVVAQQAQATEVQRTS